MGLRYLFGPLQIDSRLVPEQDRLTGECLTFGAAVGVDLVVTPAASWPPLEAQLPLGWRPDFILLDLASLAATRWPGSAALPVIGLAPDGDIACGPARRLWRQCDRIIAGPVAQRVRSIGSPAAWIELRALIDREWPSITAHAARRRNDRGAGTPTDLVQWALEDDPFDLDAAREHYNIALDVFIHHAGSRTFAALGIDCRRQLEANFALFHEKWGPTRSSGYRLPPPAAVQQTAGPKVSLCVIVKNEEANLADCLGSACDLVHEMIVVDTGSTDGTREIAQRLGERVFEFPWVDSFAAARNESLRHATGEWIFWLDADDRLDQGERQKLRALFAELKDENTAYVMKCLSPADPALGPGSETVVDHVRLFRNDPQIRWRYRVHEQIMPSLRRRGTRVQWADVIIRHVGYQEPALRRAKLERDIRLLEQSLAEEPDEPFVLFNMALVYVEQGRLADALPLLKRSLQQSHATDSIVRKLYALIVQCHRRLEQPTTALEYCREGRALYPEDAELLFQEGLILRGLGDWKSAEACLKQVLESREGDHFASVDPGLRGFKARHNLAVLYQDQGRLDEARAQWQAVTAERPDFTPAWLGLGELYLALGLWNDLDTVTRRLRETPEAQDEAALFRARARLKQKEFTAAGTALEGPIARNPRALKPRVILSHILLQEGRDLRAAEAVLREILAVDPANAEARHNLAVLLSKMN